MKIDVIPVYGKVLSNHISSCTVIVVDVLRSTSCIITAVGNGATKVVPAIDPGEAAMLASRLGAQDVVLAGEWEAVKLPDFDLGNSPYEFTKEAVCDRSVIISTTNGTAAIHRMAREPMEATDITMVCCMLYADWKQGRADLSVTKHCARLISLGFEEDIKYCFSEDITEVVPVYENGVIR